MLDEAQQRQAIYLLQLVDSFLVILDDDAYPVALRLYIKTWLKDVPRLEDQEKTAIHKDIARRTHEALTLAFNP